MTVETPDGPRLGQIRQAVVEQAEGPEIGAAVGGFDNVRMRIRFDRLTGTGTMLEPSPSFHDAAFAAAAPEAIGRWQESSRGRGAMLRLGEAAMAPGVLAELNAAGFGRHSFLCGQSGSGKSYAMGVILEQLLLETDIPIVVLDPNSDATRLQELADGADPALAERWRDIAPRIRVRGADREGDDRLRLRFFELEPALQQAVAGLNPLRDREEFDALRRVLDAEAEGQSMEQITAMLLAEADDPEFKALALRIRNLGVMEWSSWSRDFGDSGLLAELDEDDWRCLVVDLGSIALPAERSMVAAAVLSKLWSRRAQRRPVLLVIDEAHNVCPPDPADELTALRDRPRRPDRRRGAQVRHLPARGLPASAQGPRERPQPVRQPVPDADELRRRPGAAGRALLVRPAGPPGARDELRARRVARGRPRRVAPDVRQDRRPRRVRGRLGRARHLGGALSQG